MYKKITHVFAAVIVTATAFATTPAGQALLHRYPIASAIAAGVTTVAGIYHQPAAD